MSFYWRFVRPITFALEARTPRAFMWRSYYGVRQALGLRTPSTTPARAHRASVNPRRNHGMGSHHVRR